VTDEVRFAFTPTREHWRWVYGSLMPIPMAVLWLVGGVVIALGLLTLPRSASGVAYLVLGVLACFTRPLIVRGAVRRLPEYCLLPQEIALTATGLEQRNAHSWTRYEPIAFSRVHEDTHGVVLMIGNLPAVMMPREVLMPEQFAEVRRLAAALVDGAGRAA
jgi:hypothetical protein